jgi:hypothetical protein
VGTRLVHNAPRPERIYDLAAPHHVTHVGHNVDRHDPARWLYTRTLLARLFATKNGEHGPGRAPIQRVVVRGFSLHRALGLAQLLPNGFALGLPGVVATLNKDRPVYTRRYARTTVARNDNGRIRSCRNANTQLTVRVGTPRKTPTFCFPHSRRTDCSEVASGDPKE